MHNITNDTETNTFLLNDQMLVIVAMIFTHGTPVGFTYYSKFSNAI